MWGKLPVMDIRRMFTNKAQISNKTIHLAGEGGLSRLDDKI